jgi:peptidoglycan hydrolase-like protein with peptidoglycan-binding domain
MKPIEDYRYSPSLRRRLLLIALLAQSVACCQLPWLEARVLREGDKGSDVQSWQEFLVRQSHMKPPTLGNFAGRTIEGTKSFQRRHGLTASGTVDWKTVSQARHLGFNGDQSIGNASALQPSLRKALPQDHVNAQTHREVAFLKSIPPRATLAQIRKLLPKDTSFEIPRDARASTNEGPPGTWISFRGTFNGYIMFLSSRQKQMLKNYDLNMYDSPAFRYRASDPVNYFYLFMDGSRESNNRHGLQRLTALKQLLGKPRTQKYMSPETEGDGSGWMATWRLQDARVVDFEAESWQLYGTKHSVLTLHFPNSTR